MDKIARMRQEIERRKGYISVTHFAEELLSFLDTLSEEPDKSLEEEIKKYKEHYIKVRECGFNFDIMDIESTARHFAEWGAEHLK